LHFLIKPVGFCNLSYHHIYRTYNFVPREDGTYIYDSSDWRNKEEVDAGMSIIDCIKAIRDKT